MEIPVAFAAHLARDRGRSPHTVRAYAATAERFLTFLIGYFGQEPDRDVLAGLTVTDARAFIAYRRNEGLSNASTARETSALRAFLSWLATPPDLRLKSPKVKVGVPRPVTPADTVALLRSVADDGGTAWMGARDWALLLLLYGAGLRIGEALALTGSALPLTGTLAVQGKRGKVRIVPILAGVRTALDRYVALCPYPTAPGAPLFRGARGGALDPGIVRARVRSARRKLGLSERTTPHALRHSFATHLLGRGADLRQLQELLGHESLASTQVYTQVDTAHLLDVYRTSHPRTSN